MTLEIAFVLFLLIGASILLITNKMRPDLAALLLLVMLGLLGFVKPEELFLGFSRNAVITIMALFIISDGLERTGATRILGQHLGRIAGNNEQRAVLVVMGATATLSLVMNNIAAGAVLLPAVIGLTRQTDLKPQKLLMPLAFGALLGGMATLFTTANILVGDALAKAGYAPYGVLDFVPVGLPMAITGILFMTLVGRKLLPNRPRPEARERPRGTLSDAYGMRQAVSAMFVRPGSAMAGLSLAEGCWRQKLGLHVVGISRKGELNLAPSPDDEVLEGDVILYTGYVENFGLDRYGLSMVKDLKDLTWSGQLASDQVSLVEVVLAPRSAFAGKTLREIKFREKYDLSALAIWRAGNILREGLGDLPLQFGDALLLQGRRSKISLLREEPGFLILTEDSTNIETPRKALLAVALTTIAVTLPAVNLLPIAESTFAAACFMVLFGCLKMEQAYNAIEWKSVFLIAGMLPLGLAMTSTGTTALLGDLIVHGLGRFGPLAVAAGLYWAATLLSQVLSGQVTPVVLAPIAIAAAQTVGTDPRGLGMAVAMGCSTAFLTPISHSVNMLVMGPGGYQFRDYTRVGLPLSLVLFGVLLITLALFWGIR